jgi:hypothetical protein
LSPLQFLKQKSGRIEIEEVSVIVNKDSHPSKHEIPNEFNFWWKLIEFSDLQLLKHLSGSETIVEGIVTEVNNSQFIKHDKPIFWTPSGNVTAERHLQLQKQ